jgi:hypothetical protein
MGATVGVLVIGSADEALVGTLVAAFVETLVGERVVLLMAAGAKVGKLVLLSCACTADGASNKAAISQTAVTVPVILICSLPSGPSGVVIRQVLLFPMVILCQISQDFALASFLFGWSQLFKALPS